LSRLIKGELTGLMRHSWTKPYKQYNTIQWSLECFSIIIKSNQTCSPLYYQHLTLNKWFIHLKAARNESDVIWSCSVSNIQFCSEEENVLKWITSFINTLLCHHLLTLMAVQTCIPFFLLWNISSYLEKLKEKRKNSYKIYFMFHTRKKSVQVWATWKLCNDGQ